MSLFTKVFTHCSVWSVLLGSFGCGLIEVDLSDDIAIAFRIDSNKPCDANPATVCFPDPDEPPGFSVTEEQFPADVRDKADQINRGEIVSIRMKILEDTGTTASFGQGVLHARSDNEPNFPESPLASFRGVPITLGQDFRMSMTSDQRRRAAELIFPAEVETIPTVHCLFTGSADGDALHVKAEVVFFVEVEASGP